MSRTTLLFIAATLAVAGCASSRFDRLYDAGRYEAAIAEFAADSSLRADERTLFRAAVARATPNHVAYEPAQARALLEELLRRFPGGTYHLQARALATSLASTHQLAADASRIASQLTTLRERIASLEHRVALQEALHDELATGAVALRDTLQRVQLQLRVREGQMRALQEELRGLKQIDLAPIVPDTTRR